MAPTPPAALAHPHVRGTALPPPLRQRSRQDGTGCTRADVGPWCCAPAGHWRVVRRTDHPWQAVCRRWWLPACAWRRRDGRDGGIVDAEHRFEPEPGPRQARDHPHRRAAPHGREARQERVPGVHLRWTPVGCLLAAQTLPPSICDHAQWPRRIPAAQALRWCRTSGRAPRGGSRARSGNLDPRSIFL
jgi:hypothetical protein